MMEDDGTPVLADFGQSIFSDLRSSTTPFAGSARYMAPELIIPLLRNCKIDVFAFSMVALEVGHTYPLF